MVNEVTCAVIKTNVRARDELLILFLLKNSGKILTEMEEGVKNNLLWRGVS